MFGTSTALDTPRIEANLPTPRFGEKRVHQRLRLPAMGRGSGHRSLTDPMGTVSESGIGVISDPV